MVYIPSGVFLQTSYIIFFFFNFTFFFSYFLLFFLIFFFFYMYAYVIFSRILIFTIKLWHCPIPISGTRMISIRFSQDLKIKFSFPFFLPVYIVLVKGGIYHAHLHTIGY